MAAFLRRSTAAAAAHLVSRHLRVLTREASSGLRVPSRARLGDPSDVPSILPILSQLSAGSLRGTPRWVPTPAPLSTQLEQRKRSASWLEITYPFSSDAELRDLYMLADGQSLRAGMFLEELDAFSADCSMRHADGYNADRPLTVVTAAHDGLSIFGDGSHSPLSARHDLRLRGAVVSVGSSSMEVQTDLLRVYWRGDEEVEELLGSCFTVMVARDGLTFGKAAVHQLRGGDPQSDAAARAAAARKTARRELAANALALKPPSPTEVPLLHELWRAARNVDEGPIVDGDVVHAAATHLPMAISEQRNLDIMQPAQRNMNGFMFGGYLMRKALEVAWLSAYRFTRTPPTFAGLDDVVFRKPVEVGKLVEYVGRVVYTAEDGSLRVFVEAHKLSLRTGQRDPTNEFHFVFRTRQDEHTSGGSALIVQPETYEEGMLYLEGRRRWLASTAAGP